MEKSEQKTETQAPAAAQAAHGHAHSHSHAPRTHASAHRPHRTSGPARTGHGHGHSHGGAASARPASGGPRKRDRDRGRRMPPKRSETQVHKKIEDKVPPIGDAIRIIPLGGVEEIGKNMTLIQYKDDIIIVDCGFQFKDENTPGIDYILPNTKYLEENKDKIRAVIVTHGHLDHIGGIPYVMPRIGNPALYSRLLTTVMIKKRQEEFPQFPPLDIRIVEKDDTIKIGALKVRFFGVTHTIPDSMGVIIETPYGSIVHTGDLKLDHVDGVPTEEEELEWTGKFKNDKVLLLMADSTNVENPGFSIPEKKVHSNIEEIIKNVKGRLIIGTFASLFDRTIKIVEFAEKYGKKVVVEGRSMKTNMEIAKHLGILKAKKDTIIAGEEMDIYPPSRIIILATGAQGDEFAALMRMSTKSHKTVKINKTDTVLLSSSVVPGNERSVQKLKDNLSRQGAKIIHYKMADVHSSGHANRDEMAWIHKKVNAKFFMPVHGYHYMLRVHGDIAESLGMPEKDVIIPDNGTIVEIQDKGEKIVRLKEKAPSGIVMVDGFSIGDIQEVVIRDRQMLAQDGIFIIFCIVNAKTGKLRKSPDIISRGFVYLRESQDMLHQARILVKNSVEKAVQGQNPINFDFVKERLTDDMEKFLFQQTNKHPMVIPVLLAI